MKYVSIDGDDIGKKITSSYLSNDVEKLQEISNNLKESTENIAQYLKKLGFKIIFCAADGVVASIKNSVDFNLIFKSVENLSPKDITFSMGIGDSLSQAYIALLAAKSNGKNCIYNYREVGI